MKKLAFILPFLFVFTPLFAQAALTDNIVAYWKLDENTGTSAADATGGGGTGTLTNSPTWVTGKINSGLQFGGTNRYVSIPNSTALNPTTAITDQPSSSGPGRMLVESWR